MAQKKTYVYRLLIGHDSNVEVDCFMYARNAGQAIDFCKELYKDKKYNSYQAIKVGLSHTLQETQVLSNYEADQLRKAGAEKGDKFSEREIEKPQFISKEEAKELGL